MPRHRARLAVERDPTRRASGPRGPPWPRVRSFARGAAAAEADGGAAIRKSALRRAPLRVKRSPGRCGGHPRYATLAGRDAACALAIVDPADLDRRDALDEAARRALENRASR